MIIPTRNILANFSPKTFLTSGVAAAATSLPVKNTTAMETSWGLQIGETGEEQTEVVIGTASNVGTLTCPALDFEHPSDTPVYFIKYNQVVFERSTSGTAGTAVPMTDGTIEYQPKSWNNKLQESITQFDDTSGSSSYAYKTYFRNSVLAVNSTESDWFVPAGFTFYSLASLRERVKGKLWNAQYLVDEQIDDWLNEWKDEMSNAVISVNEDYALGTVDVSFGTAGLGTITTGDFSQIRRFEVTYNGVDYNLSTKQNVSDPLPGQLFSSVNPYHNFEGDNVFRVRPPENGGTARLTFYRFGTTMVNDTDELPQPMRPYTKSFVDYSLSQAFLKDGKNDEYRDKLTEANMGKQQFVLNISPRDKSGPIYVDMIEGISGDDRYTY